MQDNYLLFVVCHHGTRLHLHRRPLLRHRRLPPRLLPLPAPHPLLPPPSDAPCRVCGQRRGEILLVGLVPLDRRLGAQMMRCIVRPRRLTCKREVVNSYEVVVGPD
jgi:hypothetical protein